MAPAQLKELLLQSLEHEGGGVLVYQTALTCGRNPHFRDEWIEYLDQTKTHVAKLTNACAALGLDPGEVTPQWPVLLPVEPRGHLQERP